jgi:hypothetical protein
MKKVTFWLLAAAFTVLWVLNLVTSLYEGEYFSLIWFCSVTLTCFVIGLYLQNDFLLSTVAVASLVIEFLWTTDIVGYLVFGNLPLGIASYITEASQLRFIATGYHFLLLIIPLYVVLQRGLHRYAWIGASALLLLTFILTPLFTRANINCVKNLCELGVFGFFTPLMMFAAKSIPPMFIHWFFVTLLVFVPTHLILKYVAKWARN